MQHLSRTVAKHEPAPEPEWEPAPGKEAAGKEAAGKEAARAEKKAKKMADAGRAAASASHAAAAVKLSPEAAQEVYDAALQAKASEVNVAVTVHGWEVEWKLRPPGGTARGDLRVRPADGSAPIFSLVRLREKLGIAAPEPIASKPRSSAGGGGGPRDAHAKPPTKKQRVEEPSDSVCILQGKAVGTNADEAVCSPPEEMPHQSPAVPTGEQAGPACSSGGSGEGSTEDGATEEKQPAGKTAQAADLSSNESACQLSFEAAQEVYDAALQAKASEVNVAVTVHGWEVEWKLRPPGGTARGDLRVRPADGSAPIFSLVRLKDKLGMAVKA